MYNAALLIMIIGVVLAALLGAVGICWFFALQRHINRLNKRRAELTDKKFNALTSASGRNLERSLWLIGSVFPVCLITFLLAKAIS